jgi:signal peptidase I
MKFDLRAHLKKNRGFYLFIFVLVLVRSTFLNQYVVPSGSMEPTIAIGDRILVNRVAYDLKLPLTHITIGKMGDPHAGDVVVFESPKEPGLVLVKRLIGLPGDRIEVENGYVTLNGKKLAEGRGTSVLYPERLGDRVYTIQRIPEMIRREHIAFQVPDHSYFMMGDNRDNSADGRVFGFVDRSLLIGRANRVLFSLDFHSPWGEMVKFSRTGQAL